jgi:hypothetical protein
MNFKGILASGEVGQGLSQIKEQREMITSRWDSFGLLEGLEGSQKENMATLFENQAQYMLSESAVSDSSGAFETVAFPVIRRVFSKLLANEIVSVQALNLPVGRIYYYNPKISKRDANGEHTTLDGGYSNAADNYSRNSDGRRTGKTAGTQYETFSLYDAYYATEATEYGSALFDRTTGKIYVKSPVVSASTLTLGTTQKLLVNVTGFSTTSAGKLIGPVGIPMDTEEFLASLKITSSVDLVAVGNTGYNIVAGKEVPFTVAPQTYGKGIVDANGNLKLILDLTYPNPTTSAYDVAFSAATAPVFSANYSVYSDLEEDAEIAEVTFTLDFVTVDVGAPRKLRATFTPELAQDAAAFHSINVEAELTALLSETVAAEIDRTILRTIRADAAFIGKWDYAGFSKRTGITRQDYNQELVTVINQISAAIQKSTLRGGANWIVVSPEVASIFNNLEYFHVSDASPEETKFSLGIEKIGSLGGRYTVYVDSYAPANTILMGHKGDSILHAGLIYAPYQALMLMPKMYNYNDGKSVHHVMSRYAIKTVNNKFYGKILVDKIPTYVTGTELRGL